MDLTIVQKFIEYGIFAGLFVSLFVWTLKSGAKREGELRKTLDKFADVVGNKLSGLCNDVEDVKQDVEDIKEKLNK